jgi:hypothetical protein
LSSSLASLLNHKHIKQQGQKVSNLLLVKQWVVACRDAQDKAKVIAPHCSLCLQRCIAINAGLAATPDITTKAQLTCSAEAQPHHPPVVLDLCELVPL